MTSRVLVCGASTRAAAESAARAGFHVTALDAYADADQHPSVRALALPRDYARPFTPSAAARVAQALTADAVAYLSPFENDRSAVAALARGRRLWGNPPDVLARVRDPFAVADALRRRGFRVPALGARGSRGQVLASWRPAAAAAWLVKPFRSGGGHRVRRWQGGGVPRDCYLQEWIDGLPASVVFVAAGGRAEPLGVSRQLVGDSAFGAGGYRYCGSIMARDALGPASTRLVEHAAALADAAAGELGLVGVNGIDVVAAEDGACAIEINPRWSSSMELVEWLFGVSVFGAHAAACEGHELPRFDLVTALARAGAAGKAILFARHEAIAGDTTPWLADTSVRDVPRPGDRIVQGQPICTVMAAAADAAACYAALVRRARRVYEQVGAWRIEGGG